MDAKTAKNVADSLLKAIDMEPSEKTQKIMYSVSVLKLLLELEIWTAEEKEFLEGQITEAQGLDSVDPKTREVIVTFIAVVIPVNDVQTLQKYKDIFRKGGLYLRDHAGTDSEGMQALRSILPSMHVMPNNKLANAIARHDLLSIGEFSLDVMRKGKQAIETTCILTYEGDNVHLSGRQPFTEYDRNVYDAVSSLYVYGDPQHAFTPAMVYRTMTGRNDTQNPSPAQVAAVTRSLDKMRFIRAKVDFTEEWKARGLTLNSKQLNRGMIDTNLLMAKWAYFEAGGKQVKALQVLDVPILYEYAAAVKQVITLPASVLDVKELDAAGRITGARLPNTEIVIQIRGYLLRRIEGMKGKNKLESRIIALYDYTRNSELKPGLYSIAGKQTHNRAEMQRIREDAETMLVYWAATGYISGFETQTQGRKITGYRIIL